ncbi:ferritin-like domain-containing protein [Undibacterium sp. SXout7W]|uniref:ferritin-like domain-containing protein n=1 Tax=Undibacterium sp. SXout7W TaxID=3413049 RepID=UPI003BF41ACA
MLRLSALQAITQPTYATKLAATLALNEQCAVDPSARLHTELAIPGREALPELVAPAKLARRAMHTPEGRAILIHALAHIEMNAVDLALDIVWRFADLPEQFYRDWIKVAKEEAYHFNLLNQHLQSMGYVYGDFPGHQSLWEMAEKTQGDILARLALVPRTSEAKGLDVTPSIRDKLRQAGDGRAADILDIILHDEIGHVTIGNHWYKYICQQRGVEPIATYAELALQYKAPKLRGPFNLAARREAGFDEAELQALLEAAQ